MRPPDGPGSSVQPPGLAAPALEGDAFQSAGSCKLASPVGNFGKAYV